MDIRRVAVIFDNRPRPETTGTYCLKALCDLVPAHHFLPTELDCVSPGDFDLFLNIDDGLRYELPRHLRPAAWWAIDTHLDTAWCTAKGRQFDVVFTAQKDGAQALREAGISAAEWLPLACDPEIHSKYATEKQHDICFIGHLSFELGPERFDLVHRLRRRFPRSLVDIRYFEEMAKAYSASRLVFNRSIRNDINMRVFEALGCGSLLLTNDLSDNGQAELFRDGVHYATYRGWDELLDKSTFYLEHDDIRRRVEECGRREVLEHHTYSHRMRQLLAAVERNRSSISSTPIRGLESQPMSDAPPDTVDLTYYSHERPEVQALVPTSAKRILDVGCGVGALGSALKVRQSAFVAGIELNETAAREATRCLDRVYVADAMTVELDPEPFDCIVCADILEHLERPADLLRKLRHNLVADGQLVASIPNVRHHSVVRSLLAGNWTYEHAGLLDRTHLRFFTRREIEKLFYRCGYKLDLVSGITLPGEHPPQDSESVYLGHLVLERLPSDDRNEFYTYQFLVRGSLVELPDYGLTSIVILASDKLSNVDRCIDAISAVTDEPIELIIISDSPTDSARERIRAGTDIRFVCDNLPSSPTARMLQGATGSRGEQLVFLRDDCIPTVGWLRRMLRSLHSDPSVAAVGPSVNVPHGQQRVSLEFPGLYMLDGFAWEWAKAHDAEQIQVTTLDVSCFVVRRSVLERVGFLNDQSSLDKCDFETLWIRAREHDTLLVARDAYVHRIGDSKSQPGTTGERDAEAAFQEAVPQPRPSQKTLSIQAPPRGTRLEQTPPCTLLMITYNRLDYTKLALEAVFQVDYPHLELVIWDNASTDGTVEFVRNRLTGVPHARLVASYTNMGVVHPMNAVWLASQAPLLMKVDNDTLIPRDLVLRLAEYHTRAATFGVLSGFHFRPEDKQAAASDQVAHVDGLSVYRQPYVGGCAVMVRRETLEKFGAIPTATIGTDRPFLDGSWTAYQQRIADSGLMNGYLWPPVYVEHMEDARSPWCIRNSEHQQYKLAMRGLSIEQFTDALCVWRPQ